MSLNEKQIKLLSKLKMSSDGPIQPVNSRFGLLTDNRRKILIVGIGGRGIQAVSMVKKRVGELLGSIPDDKIAFLAFDTSTTDIKAMSDDASLYKLNSQEIININKHTTIGNWLNNDNISVPHIKKLLPNDNSTLRQIRNSLNNNGAGQERLIGKLHYMDPEVQNCIQNAISRIGGQNIGEVHIITGTGGGTGSGMSLDMTYQIRDNLAVGPANTIAFYGYIFLPDSYDEWDDINKHKILAVNGYAYLKELDYYMSMPPNEKYEIQLNNSIRQRTDRIFDICTLFGGDASANNQRRRKSDENCVDYLITLISNPKTPKDTGGQEGLLKSIYSNFQSSKNNYATNLANTDHAVSNDRDFTYCIAGTSSMSLPYKAIATYAIGIVFNNMNEKLAEKVNSASDEVIDEFEENIGFKPEVIEKRLIRKYDYNINKLTKKDIRKGYTTYIFNIESDVKTEVDTATSSEKITKLKETIFDQFSNNCKSTFTDKEKGPYYLKIILESISSRLNNYSSEATSIIADLEKKVIESKSALNNKAEKINKSEVDSWIKEYKLYGKNLYCLGVLKKLVDNRFFSNDTGTLTLYKRIVAKINEFENLSDTIVKINNILYNDKDSARKEITNTSNQNSIFSLNCNEIRYMREAVLNYIRDKHENDNGEDLFRKLTNDMTQDSSPWLSYEIGTITNVEKVRDFFGSYFNDLITRSISDYAKDAFATVSQGNKNFIENLYRSLESNAKLNFAYKGTFATPYESKYVIYPEIANNDDLKNAINDQINDVNNTNNGNRNAAVADSQSGFSIVIVKYAIPLAAWSHIAECERLYTNSTNKLIHTDGSEEKSWKRYPPVLSKYSWILYSNYTNIEEINELQKAKELFEKAKAAGIIQIGDDGSYNAKLLRSDIAPDSFKSCIQQYIENRNNLDGAKFKTGKPLYDHIWNTFGKDDNNNAAPTTLSSYNSYYVTNDETAINYLRIVRWLYREVERALKLYGNDDSSPDKIVKDAITYADNPQTALEYLHNASIDIIFEEYLNDFSIAYRRGWIEFKKENNCDVINYLMENDEKDEYCNISAIKRSATITAVQDKATLYKIDNLKYYLAFEKMPLKYFNRDENNIYSITVRNFDMENIKNEPLQIEDLHCRDYVRESEINKYFPCDKDKIMKFYSIIKP